MLFLIPVGISAGLGVGLGVLLSRRRRIMPTDTAADQDSQATAKTPFSVVNFEVRQETRVLLASESVPLDNRFGSHDLVSEHEFIQSAQVKLDLEREREESGALKSDVWKLFQLQATHSVTRRLGVEVGAEITRRVRLRFSAAPGCRVAYRVNWQQEVSRGVFLVRVRKRMLEIPFMVTYGLSHSVESIDEGADAAEPPGFHE
ncbi:MAG: hypothetical protein H7831_10595 [Magnetococcus sp. WYHC-3]